MSNHIHLVLEPTQESLQKGVHAFSSRYAQYFNRRHKRRGYLFQNRYRSILVEDSIYLKRLLRYVHLNPVDAKLVFQPQAYRWSSFRAYLMCDKYVWLNTEAILSKFGSTKQESVENLLHYTLMKLEAESDREDILRAHRKGVFGDDEEFITVDKAGGIISGFRGFPSVGAFMNLVCERFNLTREDLSSRSKSITAVDGRSVIALFAR